MRKLFFWAGLFCLVSVVSGCVPVRKPVARVEAPVVPSQPNVNTAPEPAPVQPTQPSPEPTQVAPSTYRPFTQAAYEQALAADVPVYLFFFASWCPTCRVQEPVMVSLFESGDIADLEVQAFRVNFNDNETDDAEKALAKEFGITYQHTMVLLDRSGKQIAKTFGQRSAEQLKTDLSVVK